MKLFDKIKRNVKFPDLPDSMPVLMVRFIRFAWALFISVTVGMIIGELGLIYHLLTFWGQMDAWVRPVAIVLLALNSVVLVPLLSYWITGEDE